MIFFSSVSFFLFFCFFSLSIFRRALKKTLKKAHLDVLPVGAHAVYVGVDVVLLVKAVVGPHGGADGGLSLVVDVVDERERG